MFRLSRTVPRYNVSRWTNFCTTSSGQKGPIETYKLMCDSKQLHHDKYQEVAIRRLDALHKKLSSGELKNVKGVYMHAGVGRGKTMLMDLFSGGIPDHVKKQRIHYHEFMLQVHKKLYQNSGVKDPVDAVAAEIASNVSVLCLDELEITDVADAFVTRKLFEKLWALGTVSVFTTNCVPSALYKGGINRDQFTPFISEIERHCEVICVDPQGDDAPMEAVANTKTSASGGIDYRAASEPLVGTTYCVTKEQMEATWDKLFKAKHRGDGRDIIMDRRKLWVSPTRYVTLPRSMHGMARFTFDELCSEALGNSDFLALSERPMFLREKASPSNPYVTPNALKNEDEVGVGGNIGGMSAIFLTDIPILQTNELNDTRRFINLIDLLYERNILLVMHRKPTDVSGLRNEPSDIFKYWLDELYGTNEVNKADGLKGHISGDTTEEDILFNKSNNDIEWSSAGYTHPKAEQVANDPTFTHRAIARTLSRLNEMCGAAYLKNWEKLNEKDVKMVNLWISE